MATPEAKLKVDRRRRYSNPPVTEAVCEFRFESEEQWDWTLPGLMYGELQDLFPKRHQKAAVQVSVQAAPSSTVTSRLEAPQFAGLRFLKEDEKTFVEIHPFKISVHQLAPYRGWQEFEPLVHSALDAYKNVEGPGTLARIGLRYINVIKVPEGIVEISDYVLAEPTIPESLPEPYLNWAQGVRLKYDEANGALWLRSGIAAKESRFAGLLLDLDFSTLDADKVDVDSAKEWVAEAHGQIEAAFEACITDKARAIFKEVTNGSN